MNKIAIAVIITPIFIKYLDNYHNIKIKYPDKVLQNNNVKKTINKIHKNVNDFLNEYK